jgi:hypothetical protein
MPNAWLCLQKRTEDQVAVRDGYVDVLGVQYSWDSSVSNHAALAVGDSLLLWSDQAGLLGASIIEQIEKSEAERTVYRCPKCDVTDVRTRSTLTPRYKCGSCSATFESPKVETKQVVVYKARYPAAWMSASVAVSATECRRLAISPASQHSLRSINVDRLDELLQRFPGGWRTVLSAKQRSSLAGGHRLVVVRARVGQAAFRQSLIRRYGLTCAITGPGHEATLEAAHLYRYADLGIHESDGGLLIRRDLHRAFDEGLLAIDPLTNQVSLAKPLRALDSYRQFHGLTLQVKLDGRQLEWLRMHWDTHSRAHSN